MKKFLAVTVAMIFLSAGVAMATIKSLPKGAIVEAVCNADNTATVKISGVKVETLEKYFYFKDLETVSGSNNVTFDLNDGRRFNFTFDGGYYAGLAGEMAKRYGYSPTFLGSNIDVDDSDPRGAAFIVTCAKRVTKAKR